jgi:hypothetical protein
MPIFVAPEPLSSSIFHGTALLDDSEDIAQFFARADWMREVIATAAPAGAVVLR